MAFTGPLPARVPLQKLLAFNLTGLVILADQACQLYARSQVDVLDAKPLTPWLALIWQSVTPGRPLSMGLWLAWIALALLVALVLVRLIQSGSGRLSRLQVIAFACLLGGTVSRLIDLLHWRHAVHYLWLQLPALGIDGPTSLATIAQWIGLAALGLYALQRRRRSA